MVQFRFLRHFNDLELARGVDRRKRLLPADAAAFPGDGAVDRFARALCRHRATNLRELCESFEFFALARKHSRAGEVADLCGGHGLVGALFAVFEPSVERVIVLDRSRPASFDLVCAAAEEVAPRVRGRIEYAEVTIRNAARRVAPTAGLVAVHACGAKTDAALDLALANGQPVACMPCCHPVSRSTAPAAVKREFAHDAVDIHRTYRLEAAGYHVRWSAISERITRKNRVILARPRR
ncbi:MAG: hypothetical protein NXI31_02610 [bacterium]|nr:hypothetical protein [bacterium]